MANVGGNVGGNFVAGNNNVVTFHGHTLTAADIEALNPGRALEVLSTMPIDNAVSVLATIDPRSAATIFGLMDAEQVVAFAAPMRSDRLEPIRAHVARTMSAHLGDVAAAVAAMTATAARWRPQIGGPTSGIRAVGPSKRGTSGYMRDHERGAMYWNSRTGLGMITADLAEAYERNGGVTGVLGFPVRSEKPAPADGMPGTFQRFEGTADYAADLTPALGAASGATIYRSDAGAVVTSGPIGEYYERLGGTSGPLGFPLCDAVVSTENGVVTICQPFDVDYVHWTPVTGPVRVSDRFHDRAAHEYEAGYPLADQESVTSGAGTVGWMQRFSGPDHGGDATVYLIEGHIVGPFLVDGAMHTFHEEHGGVAGVFGFPTDNAQVSRTAGRTRQAFEGGTIFVSDTTPTLGVPSPTMIAIAEVSMGVIGWPVTPERAIGDGPDTVQLFESGVVTVVDGVTKAWLDPFRT